MAIYETHIIDYDDADDWLDEEEEFDSHEEAARFVTQDLVGEQVLLVRELYAPESVRKFRVTREVVENVSVVELPL